MIFSDAQFALKAAFRRAVLLAGGPSAAAAQTRVDAARLSRYGNPTAPEFPPIDVCEAIDALAGDDVILRMLAQLRGYDLVAHQASPQSADLTRQAGAIARDSGDLISTALDAARDGKLSPNEARAIDEAAADLESNVVRLRRGVRGALKEPS